MSSPTPVVLRIMKIKEKPKMECNKCGELLGQKHFHKDRFNARGYSYSCKECTKLKYQKIKSGEYSVTPRNTSALSASVPNIIGPIVYRMKSNGIVKYIGLTTAFYIRMKRHACKSDWWPKVEEIDVFVSPSEAYMAILEIFLINKHNPEWNSKTFDGDPIVYLPEPDWETVCSLTTDVVR